MVSINLARVLDKELGLQGPLKPRRVREHSDLREPHSRGEGVGKQKVSGVLIAEII